MAITVVDINTLAKNLSGFVWASAVEATYQLVNLYMAPNGGGVLNSIQVAAVETAMSGVVMGNTTVNVLSPVYVPVDVQANIVALRSSLISPCSRLWSLRWTTLSVG